MRSLISPNSTTVPECYRRTATPTLRHLESSFQRMMLWSRTLPMCGSDKSRTVPDVVRGRIFFFDQPDVR